MSFRIALQQGGHTNNDVSNYYDAHSAHLLRRFIHGNPRIDLVRLLLRDSIAPGTTSILEIGCGIGSNASYIGRRIARHARIVGVDISPQNIQLARALSAAKNVSFECVDIIEDSPGDSRFAVIVMADVYEHIPRDKRAVLHGTISRLLLDGGKVVMTIPTPAAQEDERRQRGGLQIIDEPVTLDDLLRLARDIGGALTYYALVSVWKTNDYAHAVIERAPASVLPLQPQDRIGIKRAAQQRLHRRIFLRLEREVAKQVRRLYVLSRLGRLPRSVRRR